MDLGLCDLSLSLFTRPKSSAILIVGKTNPETSIKIWEFYLCPLILFGPKPKCWNGHHDCIVMTFLFKMTPNTYLRIACELQKLSSKRSNPGYISCVPSFFPLNLVRGTAAKTNSQNLCLVSIKWVCLSDSWIMMDIVAEIFLISLLNKWSWHMLITRPDVFST